MRNIGVLSLLVRMGATKSQLRRWIEDGLIIKINGTNKLSLNDEFSQASLCVRTAFLLVGDKNNKVSLISALDSELGKQDGNLANILKTITPIDLIKMIADKHHLQYELKKFGLFREN